MARGAITVKIDGQYDNKDIDRAIRDLNRLKTESGATKGPMDGLTGAMKGLAAGAAAALSIGAVVDFMKDAATAAIADEKSMVALATAMDNVGQGFANAGTEDFIKQLMLATGVADDQLRPAMQRLVTATGDAAESQKLLGLALDISTATGKDLTSVATALGKASMGQVSALTRLGIPLDANIVKTKDFGAAVDVLNQKFGGQAAAAAQTYGGQLQRVQTAAAEAQETIGYALLNAVEDASKAFGGAGGMVDVITQAGEKAADLVAGIGLAITALADLKASADDVNIGIGDANISLGDLAKNAVMAVPGVGAGVQALDAFANKGHDVRMSQDRINESLRASESLYAGYAAATDKSAVSTRKLEIDSQAAADALQEVSDAAKELLGIISASQSFDDFRKKLADLDTDLKGNARSFKGMGDAAKENRDSLRSALTDASNIAQKWVEDGKISADQYQAAYQGLAKKVVNQFVRDGFKRSDIEAFLGGEGIWTGPIKKNLTAAEKAALGQAKSAGNAIGRDLALGVGQGIILHSSYVQKMTRQLVREAEAAARDETQTKSPSKVWAELGKDLADGLIVGLRSKDGDVRAAMQTSFVEWFKEAKDKLKTELNDAKAAFADFKSSVSDAIMGGIDFGAAAPQFDEAGNRVGGTFIEALKAQAAQATQFAAQVKTLIQQGLSQDALQMVLQSGVQAGTAIANELISGGSTAIQQTNDLVSSTQAAADEVGTLAATNFYGAGVKSAQQTYNGFKAMFGKDGKGREAMMNLMDNLAESMKRETTITVTTVNRLVNQVVAGARAAGGPVTANKAYLVGEKGPELFIPNSGSGTIIPNSDLPTASGSYAPSGGGNHYSITVQAGVGDPRQIGQQVVEYIKKFEQTNGAAWRAA